MIPLFFFLSLSVDSLPTSFQTSGYTWFSPSTSYLISNHCEKSTNPFLTSSVSLFLLRYSLILLSIKSTNRLKISIVLSVKIPIGFFLFLLNEPNIILKIYSNFLFSSIYPFVRLLSIKLTLILNLFLSKNSGITKSKFSKSSFTSDT